MSEEYKRPFITGKVEEIGETLAIGASGFTKRNLIVETGYKFPNPLKVTLKKDATALADDLNVGDIVRVEYALDGRKWDGPNGTRYFVDIVGMKVEKIKTAASTAGAGAASQPGRGGPAEHVHLFDFSTQRQRSVVLQQHGAFSLHPHRKSFCGLGGFFDDRPGYIHLYTIRECVQHPA